jgi:CIC family chloride channel protein
MTSQDAHQPVTTAEASQARSELAEYLQVSRRQHKLFPRAALVGLCAGGVAVAFRALISVADSLRNFLIAWSHGFPFTGWLVPVLFSAGGATVAVIMVRRFAPEAAGSGIPSLKAVLHRLRELRWAPVLAVKFVGGVCAIGSGLVLGREGPTVQMGGAAGDAIGRWLRVSTRDRLTLVAAGAGAGLAAAFNAPLSGLMFVLEEVQRDFRPAVFAASFLAAAVADVVTRMVAGQDPIFAIPDYPIQPLSALPAFAVLGCVAGLSGILFNRGLLATMSWSNHFRGRWSFAAAPAVGALVGLVAWFFPMAVGGGHALAEEALTGHLTMTGILIVFAGRFVLTLLSYGTGAPGGIFAPLLGLGAMIGLAVGEIAHVLTPAVISETAVFAVVGMAAYFTAIVRAPLTGIALIVEMTGSYEQMLPLLVSCFCAYAIAEFLGDLPVYEALLERELVREGAMVHRQEPIVVEMEVEPGAPFVGREVRELQLPAGCILVRCFRDGREWVPAAWTRLAAHTRITAVITPEAMDALTVLREGCQNRL